MLEDRHYMRAPSSGLNWSAATVLLVANVVIFILCLTVLPQGVVSDFLVLQLAGLKHGYVWQLITYQFLHAGWLHLILNSLALYFFGRPVENVLGRSRFIQLYLASGVMGGLVQMLFALVFPHYFDGPVVGASAGIAGLIAAFSMIHWHDRFLLLLFFFPTAMRGRTLMWISLAMAVLGLVLNFLNPGADHVAYAAHLGGLLAGFAYIHFNIGMREIAWPWRPLQSRQRKRELVKAASIKIPRWPRKAPSEPEVPQEEFISREVDPILDKISAHGI